MATAHDLPTNLADALRLIEELQEAVHTRQRIGEAVGILMERYQLDQAGAFSYLKRTSSTTNTKLRLVAADVVADRVARKAREDEPADGVPAVGSTDRPAG